MRIFRAWATCEISELYAAEQQRNEEMNLTFSDLMNNVRF